MAAPTIQGAALCFVGANCVRPRQKFLGNSRDDVCIAPCNANVAVWIVGGRVPGLHKISITKKEGIS